MRGEKRLLLGVLFFVAVMGCGVFGYRFFQESGYKKAVAEYNRRLAEAMEKRDADLLKGVAADWERVRVRLRYEMLAAQGLYMVSSLEKLEFGATKKKGEKVTVDTVEVWRYELRDLSTGKVKQKPEKVENHLRYYLTKEDGRWVVEKIEFLKE